jgi:pSer/pThr/pTyr-binding forkhead associated (FHA) protein
MIALKADRDELIATDVPDKVPASALTPSVPARVMLRGVSGSHFGKAIAVNRRLSIGRGLDCDVVIDEARVANRHALLEHVDEAIYLREVENSGGALVNGVRVRTAVVHPGDQLGFEGSHFVVEAPGLPLRGDSAVKASHAITETMDAVQVADVPPAGHGQGAIWWLIGGAAVIALILFALIQRGL